MPTGVYIRTEENKKNLSEAFKGRKFSDETREKIGTANRGENHYLFGKKMSQEQKNKISKSMTGRILSSETKNKMSRVKIGKIKSISTRKRMSEANKGKVLSVETRAKISQTHKGEKSHFYGKMGKDSINYGVIRSDDFKDRVSKGLKKYLDNPLNYNKLIKQLRGCRIERPTKPQLNLFEAIKTKYPDKEIVMEQTVKTSNGGWVFIDVAIPDLKLGFEYDCPYWHQDKEKDAIRHDLIEAEGWQLTHYSNVLEF